MMMQLLVPIALLLTFLAVSLVTYLLIDRHYSNRMDRRMLSESGSDWRHIMVDNRFLRPLLGLLGLLIPFSVPRDAKKQLELKTRITQAGFRGDPPIKIYYGSKTLLALLVIIYLLALAPHTSLFERRTVIELALAMAAFYTPDLYLGWRVKRRRRQMFEGLPDALDLIRICVGSGLGLDASILRVGQELDISNKALSQEFMQLNAELRARVSREDALHHLAERIGIEDVNALVTMLIQSDRFGTSVTDALRVYADGLRSKRMLQAQELAAKIPAKLSIPMILCIFPALFIVILGPAALHVAHIFGLIAPVAP